MKISHRATALALALAGAATGASAASFPSTSDLAAWTVSTAVLNGAGDGQLASFDASQQQAAAAMDGRPGWISNVPRAPTASWRTGRSSCSSRASR